MMPQTTTGSSGSGTVTSATRAAGDNRTPDVYGKLDIPSRLGLFALYAGELRGT